MVPFGVDQDNNLGPTLTLVHLLTSWYLKSSSFFLRIHSRDGGNPFTIDLLKNMPM